MGKTDNNNNMHKRIHHSNIIEFFDVMSQGRNDKIQSNPIVEYEQRIRANTVLDLLSPKQGEKILDLGCGNARDIAYIAEQGSEVIGIDISEGMIAEASSDLEKLGYNNITLEIGDATQLLYTDSEFDKVLCSEVIEHIPNADKALSEIYRVLKPNGKLVLSTPNPKSWYGFDRYVIWERILRKKWYHPYDHWRSIKELLHMTEQNGFMTVRKTGACYVPGFLVTYFVLPGFLQRLLLRFVRMIEPVFSRMLPQYAYMVCVAVIKKKTK
jgi:ubiquinone biosynthesis O-methyltransferase